MELCVKEEVAGLLSRFCGQGWLKAAVQNVHASYQFKKKALVHAGNRKQTSFQIVFLSLGFKPMHMIFSSNWMDGCRE